jgi:hypothetical protein
LGPNLDSLIVGVFVESDTYKKYVLSRVGGAAQPNANAQVLAGAEIVVPPVPIQRAFRAPTEPLFDLKIPEHVSRKPSSRYRVALRAESTTTGQGRGRLDQWPLLSWMVVERLMKKLFESPITFLESFDQDADVFQPGFRSLVPIYRSLGGGWQQ